MIKDNATDIIGNTPMIRLDTSSGDIYAKLETTNPTGSVKDRMVWYMVRMAEKRGELKKGSRILEMTSGNTGIALSFISSIRGYKFIAVMPDCMSVERKRMMEAFGAKVILSCGKDDMKAAMEKYKALAKKYPDAWLPRQFENNDNIEAHRKGLGKEIAKQVKKVDAFVAGIGTGGTLIGVAKALKKVNPKVRIIGVEPSESAVLSGGKCGSHQIQGIGEGFVPKLVQDNIDLIDEVVVVRSKDSIRMTRKLARQNGLMVGISSGANVLAASLARRNHRNVVTVLPDRGERYLSNKIFDK